LKRPGAGRWGALRRAARDGGARSGGGPRGGGGKQQRRNGVLWAAIFARWPI